MVVIRVLLHLGKSLCPGSWLSCKEGLWEAWVRLLSPIPPAPLVNQNQVGILNAAAGLLPAKGAGRTHFKGRKSRHPDGFPFGSSWKLRGFRTKSSIFACRKLRDQLCNVMQAGGEALKVKKSTLYLMHSPAMLTEAFCANWSCNTVQVRALGQQNSGDNRFIPLLHCSTSLLLKGGESWGFFNRHLFVALWKWELE